MKPLPLAIVGLGLVALGGVLVWRPAAPVSKPVSKKAVLSVPSPSQPKALEKFVALHEKSRDPEIQDHVGAARLRLAYSVANTEGFAKARQAFVEAAKVHRGTGAQSAAFGGVADNAAYQAAVCLVAEGKEDAAKDEFVRFMRERPLSPLVHAAHRRLLRLNGGETKPEWDRLLQGAASKQQERIRFETSVCGPRCLERMLANRLPEKPDYKRLAELCGTTDTGTTVEGMRKGLKTLGVESWAYRLNRQDLERAELPAVVLEGDHYVLLERIEDGSAVLWDPRFRGPRTLRLPPRDDPDFFLNMILLSRPEGL
jgi:hypothetical protein